MNGTIFLIKEVHIYCYIKKDIFIDYYKLLAFLDTYNINIIYSLDNLIYNL